MFNKKRKRDIDDEYDKYGVVKDTKVYSRKNKKLTSRYNKKNYNNSLINRGPSIVPDSYSTKLKYTRTGTITSTSGVPGVQTFRGNSLFDPDQTGVGTQPKGFDELAALYDHYHVSGCKIEVSAATASATQLDDLCILATTDASPTGSSIDVYSESPYSKRIFGIANQEKFKMKSYVSTTAIFGISKSKAKADDVYSALVTADPAAPWRWHVIYQSGDRSSTQGCTVTVQLTYYCTFYDRKDLNSS